jgi:hypothetical protein
MNVRLIGIWVLCCFCINSTKAQLKTNPGQMNYLMGARTNNILYRDTVYRGSREFRQLFARTGDKDLMRLYRQHQTSKILSGVLTFAGTVFMAVGIGEISNGNSDLKTSGWILTGSGFIIGTSGGYLTLKSQQQLATAVALFNNRHHTGGLGIGAAHQQLGLVYKF